MHDVERIIHIHRLLQGARRAVSKKTLCDALGVSESTLKREIGFMRQRLDAPILGRDGGFLYDTAATDRFELPGLWFRADELHSLLTAAQLLESLEPGLLGRHVEPLKRRLQTLLAQSGHPSQDIAQRVLIKTAPRRRVQPQSFDTAATAVLRGTPLHLQYHNRGDDLATERTIHPYRLLHYRENWYVVGWCDLRGALRYFSLDRIRAARPLGIPLRPADAATLDDYIHASFGIFGGRPRGWAELSFSPQSARWVAEEIWHPDQQGEWRQGEYRLRVPYADPTELSMEIMRYGADCEVIGPPEMREEIARRHRAALERYDRQ